MLPIAALARAAFDRPLDVVAWHRLRARHEDRRAQARIARRIAATHFRGNSDLLGELREKLSTFCVDGAFEALYFRPLAMTRHKPGLCFD